MYLPGHFEETDPQRLAAVIRDNAFATLVSMQSGEPVANHLPLLHDPDAGRLLGHLAKANPDWREMRDGAPVLVIFQGPHCYISPTWYHQPGVPTWNYVVVHVRGRVSVFHDTERLHAAVTRLASTYEGFKADPWNGDYDPRMLQGIVGIDIAIESVKGKFKLSQNRSANERRAVIETLTARASHGQRGVAALMAENETR